MTEDAPRNERIVKWHQTRRERTIKGALCKTDLQTITQREIALGDIEERAFLGLECPFVALEIIDEGRFDMVVVKHILESAGIGEPIVQKVSAQLALDDLFIELDRSKQDRHLFAITSAITPHV